MNKKFTLILPILGVAMTIGVASLANVETVVPFFAENQIAYGCGDIVYGTSRYSGSDAANATYFTSSNDLISISSVDVTKCYNGDVTNSSTQEVTRGALRVGSSSATGSITYNFETAVVITRVMVYACPQGYNYDCSMAVSTTGHGETKWTQDLTKRTSSSDYDPTILYDSGTFFASDKVASSSFTLSSTVATNGAMSVSKIVLRVEKEGEPKPESSETPTSSESSLPKGHDLMVQVNEISATRYCDSILLKYGNWECLIDGGNYADKATVAEALRTYCTDHKLDLYIGTHAHDDHMGLFKYSTASNNVFIDGGITSFGYLVDNGSGRDSVAFYKAYLNEVRPWMIENGATYIPVHAMYNQDEGYTDYYGKTIINITGDPTNTSSLSATSSGDVFMKFLNTNHYLTPGDAESSSSNSPNEHSTSVCFSAFNQRYIMCGDAEGTTEAGIIANHSGTDGKPNLWDDSNDVYLKADHHGSNTESSNNQTWINWVNPDHVFISAAILTDNASTSNATEEGVRTIQHPYPATIQRFEKVTYDIHWNGINGTYRYKSTNRCSDVTFEGTAKKTPYYHNGVAVTGEETTTFPMSKWCLSSLWSACAKTTPTGHDRKPSAPSLGSFTNFEFDYEAFIEKNTKEVEMVNDHGELYDEMSDSYC